MGIPTEPLLDIMRRSMANLAFVEAHAGPEGAYEVTQLVNTFLGALAHPFEAVRDDLMSLSLAKAEALGWPKIERERPTDNEPESLGDLIRLLRNGFAHGNLEFLSDGRGQIGAVRIWNNDPRKRGARTWGAVLRVHDMRRFLGLFVELIERRHKDFGWYSRGAA
jgi:HEPN family protein